jgi:hypothetical protein
MGPLMQTRPDRDQSASKQPRAYRVLAIISATLFGLFAVAGVIALVRTLPAADCSGVSPTNYPGDPVQLSDGTWENIPQGHCVEVVTSAGAAQAQSAGDPAPIGNGFDLGPAPKQHTGEGWEVARVAITAWILWTLAMLFLAAAVAAIPRRQQEQLLLPKSVGLTPVQPTDQTAAPSALF